MAAIPSIAGMLETGICVDDLQAVSRFYKDVLGLQTVLEIDRLHAFDLAPGEVLLLFDRELSQHDSHSPIGLVPGHRTEGRAHFCFRITEDQYEPWKGHLSRCDVAIISEVHWPAGGRSFYFNDPEGNVLEMATPGLWANYPKAFREVHRND
ncbi:MAG: VOC family protein [Hyphomicrobiales bacterium]|nr:VOC family protein [Hyphomicrobiales bacterium]